MESTEEKTKEINSEDTNIENNSQVPKKKIKKFTEEDSEGTFKISLNKNKTDDVQEEQLEDKQENGELQRSNASEENGAGEANEEEQGNQDVVLEEIVDEAEKVEPTNTEKDKEVIEDAVEKGGNSKPESKEKEDKLDLPEGVDKLIEFMRDTGGSVEDYARLNTDYSKVDEKALLREYYKETKSNFDSEDIEAYIEDKFSIDEEEDTERDIRRKKLAYKEAIGEARKHYESLKEKYYNDVKLTSKLSPQEKSAIEFYNNYQSEQKEQAERAQKLAENFDRLTNNLFNEEFKGFEFNVGDKRYRYNVKDASSVKDSQSDLLNVFSKHLDQKTGMLKDAKNYHKSLFAAQNPDALAQHFYEQGRADAIKSQEKSSKNIQMDTRGGHGKVVSGKTSIKVVSGESESDFKIKKPKYFKK